MEQFMFKFFDNLLNKLKELKKYKAKMKNKVSTNQRMILLLEHHLKGKNYAVYFGLKLFWLRFLLKLNY